MYHTSVPTASKKNSGQNAFVVGSQVAGSAAADFLPINPINT
jgi:hypothetical protein